MLCLVAGPPEPRHRTARFFRPHLHQILTSKIPSTNLRLGKKLAAITDTPGDPIVLSFQDGSSTECDLLVGCSSCGPSNAPLRCSVLTLAPRFAGDGIKSAVRRHYLPDYKLEVGRAFTLRSSFPTSRLEGMEDFPTDSA
jgi:salicylate hydroxylase